jgi:CRISPR-associated protein Csm2
MTEISINLAAKVDKHGQKYAENFADDISTSQLRQVYGAVKQAEHRYQADNDMAAALRRLRLLKPKLAYLTAREESVEAFKEKIIEQIDKAVEKPSSARLEYFFRLLESFVGYHKMAETRYELTRNEEKFDHNQVEQIAKQRAQQYHEDGVETSQLRQVFGEIKRAQAEFRQHREAKESTEHIDETKKMLYLLLPKLTYIAGRHEEMREFVDDLRGWIYYVVNGGEEELRAFFELVEAVVAYHKYYTETQNH